MTGQVGIGYVYLKSGNNRKSSHLPPELVCSSIHQQNILLRRKITNVVPKVAVHEKIVILFQYVFIAFVTKFRMHKNIRDLEKPENLLRCVLSVETHKKNTDKKTKRIVFLVN